MFFSQLTKNYGVDPKITALLDKMDFVILPVANPDGYAYSWYNGGKNDVSSLWIVSEEYSLQKYQQIKFLLQWNAGDLFLEIELFSPARSL